MKLSVTLVLIAAGTLVAFLGLHFTEYPNQKDGVAGNDDSMYHSFLRGLGKNKNNKKRRRKCKKYRKNNNTASTYFKKYCSGWNKGDTEGQKQEQNITMVDYDDDAEDGYYYDYYDHDNNNAQVDDVTSNTVDDTVDDAVDDTVESSSTSSNYYYYNNTSNQSNGTGTDDYYEVDITSLQISGGKRGMTFSSYIGLIGGLLVLLAAVATFFPATKKRKNGSQRSMVGSQRSMVDQSFQSQGSERLKENAFPII